MAAQRKSAVALAARERARAQAEEITRRNEELIELAAEFFVQDDKLVEIDTDLEKKIRQLHDQADKRKLAAQAEASSVVQRMVETGEAKKSIADRLGLSAAELKRYLGAAAPAKASAVNTQDNGTAAEDKQVSDSTDSEDSEEA